MAGNDTIIIIVSILVPMLGGFAWMLKKLGDLDRRVTIIETILAMMGAPIKKDH